MWWTILSNLLYIFFAGVLVFLLKTTIDNQKGSDRKISTMRDRLEDIQSKTEVANEEAKVLDFIGHNSVYLTRGDGNHLLTVNDSDVALLTSDIKMSYANEYGVSKNTYGYNFSYLPNTPKEMVAKSKVLEDNSMGFKSLVSEGRIEIK